LRYVLNFGDGNEGGSPSFILFRNTASMAAVTPPTFTEIAEGAYYFDWDWTTSDATSITYIAALNGTELHDTIEGASTDAAVVSVGGASGLNGWLRTAGQIINDVAVETGISSSTSIDPYAATDANYVQLRTLLKSALLEIAQVRDWTVLVRECTITGDGALTTFALPTDFLRMKEDAAWNRSSDRSFTLASPAGWQKMKAWGSTVSLSVVYRIQQGRMVFYEAPPSGESLVYEYVSRYLVAATGSTSADAYFPTATGDTVMLDAHAVSRLLKAKFLQAKSLDSVGAFAEYEQALEMAANNEPAPDLYLGGSPPAERFIDTDNLPDTITGIA
jgi:hypothetical protein